MAHPYEYYRKLITPQYRFSPNYMAWVQRLLTYKRDEITADTVGEEMKSRTFASVDTVGAFMKGLQVNFDKVGVVFKRINYDDEKQIDLRNTSAVEKTAEDIISAFDVDNAVGPQLDILGRIVGVGRVLKFQPSEDSPVMDDETYRLVIKAAIIKNQWKGNAASLKEAWMNLYPDTVIFEIQDLQDMSFNIVVSGEFTTLQREIITNGYILPKPEGVRINLLTIVDLTGFPLFTYDYDTLYMSGYGSHWASNATVGGN